MRKTVGSLILLGLLLGIILIANLSQAGDMKKVDLAWERGDDSAIKHYEIHRVELVSGTTAELSQFKKIGTSTEPKYEDEVDEDKSWGWYVVSVWSEDSKSSPSIPVYLRVEQPAN